MIERNIEIFNSFVKEFLDKDSTYKQQIENFQKYLKTYSLEDKVFNLYETKFFDDLQTAHQYYIYVLRYFLILKTSPYFATSTQIQISFPIVPCILFTFHP